VFVPTRFRGRGIAKALVLAAVDLARSRGAREIEAYPQATAPGERAIAAFVWTGVPSLFEAASFKPLHKPDRGRCLYLLQLE
jgi:GNAT superfamily N-acetyltransferase